MTDTSRKNMLIGGALAMLVAEVALLLTGHGGQPESGVVLFLMFYSISYFVKQTKTLSGLSFTFQIFAFVAFTLYFPQLFTNWGFNTKILVVPSVQVIMFSMGTKLSLADFAVEFRKPAKIIVGTLLVYTMMPLAGYLIINLHKFPDEVAAGIILIGVCPTGAASNVMTYLARGNLALALSITTLATLISPLATPSIMRLFAGKLIAVDTLGMVVSLMNMIMVPIFAGLICNRILYGKAAWLKKPANLIAISVGCFAVGLALIFVPFAKTVSSLQSGLVLVLWAVAAVSITKMLVARAQGPVNWMDLVLPKLSLTSIMLYIVIVTAHNKATLLSIGPALFIATIAHNFLGFILGYSAAKALRLNDIDVRTMTIEVGLKNGGVGVGLAYDVLKSEAAALAPLVFGTWMNISGSTLANYWRQRTPREEQPAGAQELAGSARGSR
jgi:bile acid:Na+ symporter, BASS family